MAGSRSIADDDLEPLAILGASAVFRHLSADVLRDLAATARVENFKSATLLIQRNARPKEFRYIRAGGIQLSLTTADGKEARLPAHRAGEWATWPSCFSDKPLAHDLWCLPASKFLTFPATNVRSAVVMNPDAAQAALAAMSALVRSLVAWSLTERLVTGEQRVAQVLLAFSERASGTAGEESMATISHVDLGQLGLGSRQHVAGLLKSLEARGLVERGYRSVKICSVAGLREFASSGI